MADALLWGFLAGCMVAGFLVPIVAVMILGQWAWNTLFKEP